MKNHFKEIHLGIAKEKFDCTECDKSFKKESVRNDHYKSVHQNIKFTCEECGVQCSTVKRLEKHKKTVHENKDRRQCQKCDKVFQHQASLWNHMASAHSGKTWTCEICAMVFVSKATLRNHRKNVHENKGQSHCQQCDKVFQHPGSLWNHMVSEHSNKTFVCEVCSKTFTSKMNLKKHLATHKN